MKSAELSAPKTSIRPATTLTAPAMELATASTSMGMLPKAATRPTTSPTATPTSTATQFQSMPRATTSPEPIAKPNAAIAMMTATA